MALKIIKLVGAFIAVLSLIYLIFLVGFYFWLSQAVDFEPILFNSDIWKASEPEWSWESVRLKMVDDLKANYIHIGLSESGVLKLIGPPTDTEYFSGHDLVYYLGQERNAIGIDSEWLLIDLEDGVVSDVSIATD